jgi:hypothetical protein
MLNPFQKICAHTYGGGDFGHVADVEEARAMGDTLFTFLMIELSTGEGCDSHAEACRRLERAITDVREVMDALDADADAAVENPSAPCVTLLFRPQAWINDHAVSVDSEHPDRWTVPLPLLLSRFPAEQDWHEHGEDRDAMRLEGNAPRWIREWSGPFEVELVDADNPWIP